MWSDRGVDPDEWRTVDDERAVEAAVELRNEEWAYRQQLIEEGKCPDSGLPQAQCALSVCDCFEPVRATWRDGTPVPEEPPET